MHRYVTEQQVTCPACGEAITLLVDASAGNQDYIEDCEVCCRPMRVLIEADDGDVDNIKVDSAS